MYLVRDGEMVEEELDDLDVEWELDDPNRLQGTHAGTIPMYSAVQSPRLFYGERFANQAVALKEPEAPWVQTLLDPKKNISFEEQYGQHNGAVRSDLDGVVEEVDSKHITLRTPDGQTVTRKLFDLLPFNRKSSLSQKPTVRIGQEVRKGDLLARSNFTDQNGTLALGRNARVAIVPFEGYSQDDATVISNSFAQKLSSEKTLMFEQEYDENIRGGRDHYHALFPEQYTQDQLGKMDEGGVVLEGQVLQPGDPIVLATRPRSLSSAKVHLGHMGRAMKQTRGDASQVWDGRTPAEVLKVVKLRNGSVKILTRSYAPAQEGDKIVFRAGAKGVVSKVLSDEEMPRGQDGNPFEVLYNPAGLVSRANDEMVYEVLLGKIAALKGEPIKLPEFTKPGENWYDLVEKALQEAGLEDAETLYDPREGRELENPVTTGNAYVLKLHHEAESKLGSRGEGGYSADDQPTKGGDSGAKRTSGLEVAAMQSSGAYHNLREMSTLRGQRNFDYWQQLRQGQDPLPPGQPFVWNKYLALLQGAGMKADEQGDGNLRLGPMTDQDLEQYGPVEIRSGRTVDLRTLEPVEGGLFDPALVSANRWGQIPLPRPVLNPAFEEAVRRLLRLKKAELREVMAGRRELD